MNNEYAVAMAFAILGSVAGDFLVKKAASRSQPKAPGGLMASPNSNSSAAGASQGISSVASTKSFQIRTRWLRLLQLIAGLTLLTLHFGGFLIALKLAPVTVTIPLMSCTYILTTMLGKIFLHEPINRTRWTGIGVIIIGVILLELSTRL